MTEQPPATDVPSTSTPESETPETAVSTPAREEPLAIQPEEIQPEPSAPVPLARPVRRHKGLIAALIVLAVLLLTAGGGFAYLRLNEVNLLEKAQVDLASGNWQAVEAGCTQLFGLPASLLVEPQRCLPLRGEAYYQLGKFDLAQTDLQSAQARYPDQAKPYLLSAEIYLQQNQSELALTAAGETIKRDPTQVRPHMIMVGLYQQQGKSDLALAAAVNAQKLDDTLALPYTLQAVDAYQRNLPKEAEKAARAALDRDPAQALALSVLGSLQSWRSEYKTALENLNKAIQLDPQDPHALIERAVVYYWMDQFSTFQSEAKAILAKEQSSAGALMIQALQADLAHEPQKAYDFIDQAIQLDDTRPEYYFLRAFLFPTTGKENQSKLADFTRALELNPDLYLAQWLNLVARMDLYEQVDAPAEAQRLLNAAPELDAGYDLMVYHFMRQMDLAQALDWANRYVVALPEVTHSYNIRAWVYLQQKEYDKAQADYEKMLEIYPDSINARLGLVRIKANQKNYTDALKLANEAVVLAPNLPAVYTTRSFVHSQNKEPVLAREDLTKALELDPLNVYALTQSAYLYIDDKDYLKATDATSKIAEVAPKAPDSFTLRASVYRAQDDYERALEEIKKSIAINPMDPWTQNFAAQTCFSMKQYDQTLTFANAAIKLDAKDSVAWGLVAQTSFTKKDYTQTIVAANKSLDIDPAQAWLYGLVSDASLAQGDYVTAASSLEKALKYQDQLTVDQVQLYEQSIAFYKTVPPLVNGLRTVNDPEHGFSVSYSADWTPISDDQADIFLTLTSKDANDIKLSITTQAVSAAEANQISAQIMADYMQQLLSLAGYTFSARTNYDGLQPGIVDTFEGTGTLWDDSSKVKLRGQIYYFYVPGRLVLLMYITISDLDTYSGQVEKIAATLKVIP